MCVCVLVREGEGREIANPTIWSSCSEEQAMAHTHEPSEELRVTHKSDLSMSVR
jgi:hypothetical protein